MKVVNLAVTILLVLLFVGRLSAQTPASDSLTLEQAVHLALQNHPAVQQAEYGVAASEARIGASRSSLYPDISFDGSYVRIGPVPKFDLPGEGSLKLAPYDNYDLHLGLNKTLYDFGRINTTVKLAESARQISSAGVAGPVTQVAEGGRSTLGYPRMMHAGNETWIAWAGGEAKVQTARLVP